MSDCLVCGTPFEPFLDFGPMPIANGFLSPDQFRQEKFYPLKVGFCTRCSMVQLCELVDREEMFHEAYAYFSSTSSRMVAHFRRLAQDCLDNYLTCNDPFIVEIGSNDGIFLQNFASREIRHLGLEPSRNVAAEARSRGIETITEFFDEALAEKIVAENGPADVCVGANVMCHIPYIGSVASGVRTLLKPEGVLIFEDPYLGDIIAQTAYDQIYDEHAFYFSLSSVRFLFEKHGLKLVAAHRQPVHGGSMRYILAPEESSRQPDKGLEALTRQEQDFRLTTEDTFVAFKRRVEESRRKLKQALSDLREAGKRVVGYGATSKSTTVTNYCGITADLVEFISDTTPIKQGKFSPGVHIPVRSYENFQSRYPDYALLFAWNHAEEIFAKESQFRELRGRWIRYVPEVEIVG